MEGLEEEGALVGTKQPWSLNLALSRARDTIFDRRHSDEGIEPVNEFELSMRVLSEVKSPRELGT